MMHLCFNKQSCINGSSYFLRAIFVLLCWSAVLMPLVSMCLGLQWFTYCVFQEEAILCLLRLLMARHCSQNGRFRLPNCLLEDLICKAPSMQPPSPPTATETGDYTTKETKAITHAAPEVNYSGKPI